jgi:hypothetical protein
MFHPGAKLVARKWLTQKHVLVKKCRKCYIIVKKVSINIITVIVTSGNKANGYLPSSKSSLGCYQLIAIIKTLQPAQWGILRGIHLGVMDRGLFNRPFHSVKTAVHKRRSRSVNRP